MTSAVVCRAVETAVLLPGTGSDEVFVRNVFAGPLADAGLTLVAPRPRSGPDLADAHLAALDAAAAEHGAILAGGISFGAHLAAEWALARPGRCAGLLVALPGWHGPPGDAPGSVAARTGADAVAGTGIDRTLAAATRDVPPWLARELDRSWRRAGAGLAESLLVAACRPAPTLARLRDLRIPAGVAGCVDDAVHPLAVARAWAGALPHAGLRTITFAQLGADPATLGRAVLAAFERSRVQHEIADRHPDHHDDRDRAEHQR